MIKINRNNYEMFFMDFLDGNLSQQEIELLMAFLEQNPDLKKELESFDDFLVQESEEIFKNKQGLKKELLSNINENNFNELCIAELESDLSENESREFLKFVKENKKREKEFKLYNLTKLKPDYTIRYEDKENLKIKLGKKINFYSIYSVVSIAASIVLFVALYFFISKQEKDNVSNNSKISELKQTQLNTIKVEPTQKDVVKSNIDAKNISDNESAQKNSIIKEEIKERKRVDTNRNDDKLKRDDIKLAYLQTESNYITVPELSFGIITDNILVEYNIEEEKSSKEYISIKSFISQTINNKILKKGKKNTIEFFDIAQAGVDGINKLTKGNMTLERIYDEKGNPQKTQFSSRLVAFSAPIKNN